MKPSTWVLFLAVLGSTQPALAYCRTTTIQAPAGYDPVASGCWTNGKPLAWHTGRAPYGVNKAASKQVTLAEATRIANLAFGSWNAVSCSGSAPAIQAYDDGPLSLMPDGSDCTSGSQCNPSTHDVIVFDDDVWPHDDPANVLALTTVTFGVEDGTIFEAYTEVNSTPAHLLSTTEPPPAGTYDLQAVLTHEAGHFFGLAHATENSSVMYAFYLPGKIHLTSDDESGFCATYPHSKGQSGGCATAAGTASASDLGAGCLLSLGFALAAARVGRRGRSRRAQRREPRGLG